SVEPGSSLTAFRFGDWLLWALGALVSFGLIAICQKLATNRISAESTFAMFAAGFIPVAIIAALMERWPRGLPTRPVIWAILGGLLNGLGVLATIAAYRKGGKVSIVTPLAALSAAVTVLLAVLWLREPVTEIQSVGIGLALLAGFCLARE
ncbi:MAG: DMT family transporter, partial [Phycisphaerales bacterium]|nr:DMT family transporter [Phycisphaerales bacterium]